MQKNKYQIAREIVEEYNHAYLQGDTFLHIQEWLDEQAKEESKKEYIKIDEDGNVLDIDKKLFEYCASCGSKIKYHKVAFSKTFVPVLQKILDHVVDYHKNTGEFKKTFDIADLNFSNAQYSNINRIANFGLLFRKTDEHGNKIKDGTYGVPVKRIADFLKGDWQVAKFYVVKSTTHERRLSKERISIDQLPEHDGWTDYKTKRLPGNVQYLDLNNIG